MKMHALSVVLCLLPVAAIAVLLVIGVHVQTALVVGVLLLCPVLHVVMMRHGSGKGLPHREEA